MERRAFPIEGTAKASPHLAFFDEVNVPRFGSAGDEFLETRTFPQAG